MYFFFDSCYGKERRHPYVWTHIKIGGADFDCTYTRQQIELLAESKAKTKKQRMLGLKPGKELDMFKLHRAGYLVLYRMTDEEIKVWQKKKDLKDAISQISAEIYERTKDLQEKKKALEKKLRKIS